MQLWVMTVQVPNEVLGEWVLLRAKVQPSQLAPFSVEGNQVRQRGFQLL